MLAAGVAADAQQLGAHWIGYVTSTGSNRGYNGRGQGRAATARTAPGRVALAQTLGWPAAGRGMAAEAPRRSAGDFLPLGHGGGRGPHLLWRTGFSRPFSLAGGGGGGGRDGGGGCWCWCACFLRCETLAFYVGRRRSRPHAALALPVLALRPRRGPWLPSHAWSCRAEASFFLRSRQSTHGSQSSFLAALAHAQTGTVAGRRHQAGPAVRPNCPSGSRQALVCGAAGWPNGQWRQALPRAGVRIVHA